MAGYRRSAAVRTRRHSKWSERSTQENGHAVAAPVGDPNTSIIVDRYPERSIQTGSIEARFGRQRQTGPHCVTEHVRHVTYLADAVRARRTVCHPSVGVAVDNDSGWAVQATTSERRSCKLARPDRYTRIDVRNLREHRDAVVPRV